MARKAIWDTRDLTQLTQHQLQMVDKAVCATAFRLRDDARSKFKSSLYKYKTSKYDALAEGIMVGRLRNSQIKVHALGTISNYHSYKTRFFVGGTRYRTQTKKQGQPLSKPYTKGYISGNDALDKAASSMNGVLDKYVSNALNK